MKVPPASPPAWNQLLHGEAVIKPAFMAARMLIVCCRMRLMKAKQDPAELSRCALQLRELYAENAGSPSAWCDLDALFRRAPSEPRQATAGSTESVAPRTARPRRGLGG